MIFSLCHVFLYFFVFITDEGVLSGDFIKNGDDVLKLLVEWSPENSSTEEATSDFHPCNQIGYHGNIDESGSVRDKV